MSRIDPVAYEAAGELKKREWDDLVASGHPVTNMKAVALHSTDSLAAILTWYDLFAKVKPFLGERLAVLYCHGISEENQCDLCHTFMRKEIIDGGEDPQNLTLDERDRAVIAFGRQLAKNPNRIGDRLFEPLRQWFSDEQLVDLVTFGALMVVNNIFNSALQIPLDEHLDPYRIHPEQVLA